MIGRCNTCIGAYDDECIPIGCACPYWEAQPDYIKETEEKQKEFLDVPEGEWYE